MDGHNQHAPLQVFFRISLMRLSQHALAVAYKMRGIIKMGSFCRWQTWDARNTTGRRDEPWCSHMVKVGHWESILVSAVRNVAGQTLSFEEGFCA
jgi:hypothetical protein